MRVRCPNCHNPLELADDSEFSEIECPSCGSSFSLLGEQTATFQKSGARTVGHFDLLEQVGVGAFGSVWRARDTQLDRTVAVKLPRRGQLDGSESEQFLREARSAAQLKHPNIVGVHEVGRQDDQVFIVSDFVEGLPLSSWLSGKQPTFREAAALCAKIAEALHHAHEAGVIHRDLKPSNIMLDAEGEPHIMDFGLAKREAGDVTMTMEGKVLGTPAYMSPEQAGGKAHAADRRTDVYSLGVIIFELLTGERPFRGDYRMLLHQVLNEEAPGPKTLKGSVPRDLDTICLKCLEKQPEKRYATAQAVADELSRFLRHEPIKAHPVTAPGRVWRWCRRNPSLAALSAALTAVLLTTGVAGLWIAIQQTALAKQNEQLATDAITAKEQAQQFAQQEASARRQTQHLLYASDMNVASRALSDGNIDRLVERLIRHQPHENQEDLRGFEWYHLWQMCKQHLQTRFVRPEDGPVNPIAISPDGLLAVGSLTLVTLWDLETLERRAALRSDSSVVRGVAFSPDGKQLASANRGGDVKLWNLDSLEQVEQRFPHDSPVLCVEFAPRERILASGSSAGVTLWDLATGRSRSGTPFPAGRTRSLAFSRDGTLLASGSQDGVVQVWDVASALERNNLNVGGNVVSVDFSPDSNTVAIRSDGLVGLWNWKTSELVPLAEDGAGFSGFAVFSPDGERLASNGSGNTVKLWHVATGKELASVLGHSALVASAVFQRDHMFLATGSWDGTVRLWDLPFTDQPSSLSGHSGGVVALSFSPPNGAILASASADSIRLWNTRDWSLREEISGEGIRRVALSSDARTLAYSTYRDGASDDGIKLRNMETGYESDLEGEAQDIRSLVFTPDGRYLAACGDVKGVIEIFDLWSGDRHPLPGHDSSVKQMALSSEGEYLASASADRTIKVWDVRRRELWRTLEGHSAFVDSVAFSKDGMLASGSADRTVRLWNVEDVEDEEGTILSENADIVFSMVFSPDGTTLATEGGRTMTLWNVDRREERVQMSSQSSIGPLAFSPDGRVLVAGLADGSLKLWHAATEEEVRSADWWASIVGGSAARPSE